ncbi:MAG: hybrid sensor histidine kinase/response regulator [Bryobacteraceae bacterium]|jgi:two-component system chemotaxis sensor kinase CheA
MSDFNLDDDLILDYLAECREHLTTIETDLLSMEQAGAAIDEQLVNRVFRAAHSIKGGAGFFDLLKIKELAHRTENVLDLVRSGQMVPTSEIVSILLMAFDKLRNLILDYAGSNSADISEFTDALSRLTEEHLSPERKSSTHEVVAISIPGAGRLISGSAFDLDQARLGGKTIYAIEYDLIHDIQRRGKTPLEVLNHLIKLGSILATAFDLDSAGTLDDEPSNKLLLDVLYATVLDSYSIGLVLDVAPERIHRIENDGVAKTLTSVATATVEPFPPGLVPDAAPVLNAGPARDAAPAPAVAAPAEQVSKQASPAQSSQVETTVRLNVALLDSLMTLAGELVLGRNQLNEAVRLGDKQGVSAGAHRISLVTSELQEAVSLTRMQPVAGLFAKFSRLVRDLAGELGKEVQLKLEGGEVELDKTIIEGLSDPLTHMVRNSVDHGIESAAVRIAAGKPAMGTVILRARHQAGQVMIEISDDGKGLAADKIGKSALAKGMITAEQLQTMSEFDKHMLIFGAGVSTAEKLTNVSGRGVGMDVVKTNLDKLGGKIEIDSVPGKGSAFRIKLPLTLAIIPSLLVSDSGERFAIPQVSVGELIRIPANQIAERTDRAGDAELVLLRDRLVPLVYLAEALGSPRTERGSKALNIVLVDTGAFEYGLVVGDLHDTVEIVVKPMGRHLQTLREYAGATILGDGQVAVILDVAGLAQRAGLSRTSAPPADAQVAADDTAGELHSLLLFHNAPGEHCAVPIELVTRVERVRTGQIERLGGRRTMQYGGVSLPLVTLHDVAAVDEIVESQQWVVVVFDCAGRTVGLLVAEPLDMIETRLDMDTATLRQPGVAGSALLNGNTTLMLDIFELADTVRRRWPETETVEPPPVSQPGHGGTVLVAEDSDFFRGQIKRLIEAVGYKVLAAEDGQSAWELLDSHASEISVVTTDVEMPRLDGLGLTKRIRADSRFTRLPIIALSSLAGEEEMARGLAMGVSEYQVKLDQSQLLESIRKAVSGVELDQSPVTA